MKGDGLASCNVRGGLVWHAFWKGKGGALVMVVSRLELMLDVMPASEGGRRRDVGGR